MTEKQKFWDEERSPDQKAIKLFPHSYEVFGRGAIWDIVYDEVDKIFPLVLVERSFIMLPPHATRNQIESIQIGVEKRINELQSREEIRESTNMLRVHLEKLEVTISDALAELRYILKERSSLSTFL